MEGKLIRSFKNRKICEKEDAFQKLNLQKESLAEKANKEDDSVFCSQKEDTDKQESLKSKRFSSGSIL